MNLQQALVAVRAIDTLYLAPTGLESEQRADGLGEAHLRWMVQAMHNNMPEAKVMRWLGYIQGVLVAEGKATLAEMKHISMKASKS